LVGYLAKEIVLSNVIAPIISNFAKITPLFLSLLGALFAFVIYDKALY